VVQSTPEGDECPERVECVALTMIKLTSTVDFALLSFGLVCCTGVCQIADGRTNNMCPVHLEASNEP